MKRRTQLLDKEPFNLHNNLYGFDADYKNQEFLIFVVDVNSLKIERINNKAHDFLQQNAKNGGEINSFEKIVQPDQLPSFYEEIKSGSNLSKEEEKEIAVFLKIPTGEWKEFIFKNRLFQNECGTGKKLALCVAKEIESEIDNQNNYSSKFPDQKETDKYRSIIEAMDFGFCIIDMIYDLKGNPVDYLFVETNPAFKKHMGTSTAEGKTVLEITGEHEKYWFDIYGEVVRSGNPVDFENFAKNVDNKWFKIFAFPVGDGQNKKVAVIFNDITKRKDFERQLSKTNILLEQKVIKRTKELKENSELLQTIFDTTNEGIVVFEPVYNALGEIENFRYIRVNQIIIDQYQRSDLVDQLFTEVNPDDSNFGVFEALKRTMRTGIPEDFEVFYNKDNCNLWFRVTTKKNRNFVITSLEDITQRKLESQQLQDTIQFKRQLAKTSPDIILIFDLYDENVKYINRDMAKLRGMRKKDITGMDLMQILPFIHPREREKAMEFHRNILEASDKEILDIEFRLKKGKSRWEWHNACGKVFMRNEKGNVYQYIILLRSVHKQKETQKALLHAEKLSIKGEVARTLAHELRNPLASIGMAADILTQKAEKLEANDLANYSKIIKRGTKTLNSLVTELLSSSSYKSMVFKKCCLAEILEETLTLASDRIYLLGIKVIKKYKSGYYINADLEKLKIALLNIIINASEAMDPNEGILILEIKKSNEDYILSISDNGCGLEKEQLNKLFEEYYTHKADGMGIGLSSVKNILEDHDAHIEVDSQQNVGTSFFLSFHCYQNHENG